MNKSLYFNSYLYVIKTILFLSKILLFKIWYYYLKSDITVSLKKSLLYTYCLLLVEIQLWQTTMWCEIDFCKNLFNWINKTTYYYYWWFGTLVSNIILFYFALHQINISAGISQLQWSLEFLRNIRDETGEYPEYVNAAIVGLEDRLLELYASVPSFLEDDEPEVEEEGKEEGEEEEGEEGEEEDKPEGEEAPPPADEGGNYTREQNVLA